MEIYLDNSATTRVCREAAAACCQAMETVFGNPSSLHKKGFAAEQLADLSKTQLAAALSCAPGELLFTSGATEANNLALIGTAEALKRRGKTILTTAVEHPSVLETAQELERRGFRLKILPPAGPEGYTPEQFAQAVDEDTILVSAMMVNNETGLILPVKQIAQAVKAKNPQTLVHTDGVQAFLKLPVRLKSSGLDLFSISGHKAAAPKGIGALWIRKGVRLLPRSFGGGQQAGLRSGTEPVQLYAAFGAAAEAQLPHLQENLQHYRALKEGLLEQLASIPEVTVHSGENCAPHIVSLAVRGIRSEILLHYLEQFEIYVSSGSACSKGKPSGVLEALGVDRRTADETVRVSFCADTTKEMLEELVFRVKEGISSLAKQR